MISRRKFLLGGAAALIGVASYTRYFEPDWFELCRRQVTFFKDGRKPLRVLFLADLHYSKCVSLTMIERAIDLGLAQAPDLILLGGDQVLFDMELDFDAFSKVLAKLTAMAPTFACFGNHDRAVGTERNQLVANSLAQAGIRILYNQAQKVKLNDCEFELIGLGDFYSSQVFPEQAFPDEDEKLPRLVLAHNPDSKDLLQDYRWDLMCCGHTHGGQFCVPLLGPLYVPVQDKRYVAGLNEWQGRQIYTTRGVGNLHGVRFNCRPEVTLLELV